MVAVTYHDGVEDRRPPLRGHQPVARLLVIFGFPDLNVIRYVFPAL